MRKTPVQPAIDNNAVLILISLEPLVSQTILLDRNMLELNSNKIFWKTVISMQMINNWTKKYAQKLDKLQQTQIKLQ